MQTIAIVFLVAQWWYVTSEVNALRAEMVTTRAALATPPLPHTAADRQPPSEAQLRRLIAAQMAAQRPTHEGEDATPPARVSTPAIVSAIESELDYFISMGTISEVDMQQLQAKIARLDDENRQAMLNKLVGAMNAGLIDARL